MNWMRAAVFGAVGIAVLFLATTARADSVDIALTQSSQTAAGSVVTFDATVTNLSSTDTIFLNGDSSVTSSLLLTVDDTPFLTNFPLTLDPGQTTGPFDLFSVLIDPGTPDGTYDFNSFSILGGLDGNASDIIGAANFSVTVGQVVPTPEPGALGLLVIGVIAIGACIRRERSTTTKCNSVK